MGLFSFFQLGGHDQDKEAARQHRYQYGIQEVQRWTKAKKSIAEGRAELIREYEQTITEHIARWGYGGEGLKWLEWNMEAQQERTEELLQEAEKRLTVYRNIVLMQGRI